MSGVLQKTHKLKSKVKSRLGFPLGQLKAELCFETNVISRRKGQLSFSMEIP